MALQVKIFIGYYVDKVLRLQIEKSSAWSEEKSIGQLQLTETKFNEKDYIGSYLQNYVDISLIEQKEKEVKTRLQYYCPKFILDNQKAFLFPQIFIG
jgi:hypothetical protein